MPSSSKRTKVRTCQVDPSRREDNRTNVSGRVPRSGGQPHQRVRSSAAVGRTAAPTSQVECRGREDSRTNVSGRVPRSGGQPHQRVRSSAAVGRTTAPTCRVDRRGRKDNRCNVSGLHVASAGQPTPGGGGTAANGGGRAHTCGIHFCRPEDKSRRRHDVSAKWIRRARGDRRPRCQEGGIVVCRGCIQNTVRFGRYSVDHRQVPQALVAGRRARAGSGNRTISAPGRTATCGWPSQARGILG